MNNHYEMPKDTGSAVPEKAIRKVAQIYTEYLTQPAVAEGAIVTALQRIEGKENISIDGDDVRIAALECVAENNGGVLPEGTLPEWYKEKVVESVVREMCAEAYDPDDPEKVVEYTNKPRKLLIAHEPFRVMFSGEINDIAENILGDERLQVQRENFNVWDIVEEEYKETEE
jgi:hypothetical protein